MNYNRTEATLTTSAASHRMSVPEMLTAALLVASIVIAVLQPAWLTVPLRGAVANAGAAAPVVFMVLCAITAPLHLNGVLVALSTLFWPLPVAGTLSFVGSLTGCVTTAALLRQLSGAVLGRWANGSGLLRWLFAQVARRPLLIGLVARIGIGSGMALEAFYLLAGYTRRQYLLVTFIGIAIWVTQALVGVTVLRALSQLSPWLAILMSVVAPLLGIGGGLAVRKLRQAWSR